MTHAPRAARSAIPPALVAPDRKRQRTPLQCPIRSNGRHRARRRRHRRHPQPALAGMSVDHRPTSAQASRSVRPAQGHVPTPSLPWGYAHRKTTRGGSRNGMQVYRPAWRRTDLRSGDYLSGGDRVRPRTSTAQSRGSADDARRRRITRSITRLPPRRRRGPTTPSAMTSPSSSPRMRRFSWKFCRQRDRRRTSSFFDSSRASSSPSSRPTSFRRSSTRQAPATPRRQG